MLAILPTAITLLLMYFVDVHNTHERYNKKFLDAFSLIAVTVATYLMIIIICDQVFTIRSAVQSVCFVILLLLVLSPVAVALKAQKPESMQHEESTSEQRIGLLREEVAEGSDSAGSSTALGGSNLDLSAGKENLNVLQAMGKLNFWLLFLAMACGMGSGLPWLPEQGDQHTGVALEHLELLREVWRRIHLGPFPSPARSWQAILHRRHAIDHECGSCHHLLRPCCIALHRLRASWPVLWVPVGAYAEHNV